MEYIQVNETSTLPGLGHLAPFKAVIAIEDPISAGRQQDICRWLVDAGCMYVMVCGEGCEDWQEIIRTLNLDQVSLDDMKPEQFIMVTTHAREGLRSVFWHAKKHAHHPKIKMQNIVTVHIGEQNRSVDYGSIFQKA